MAIYILQVSLCWLGFYLVYRILLSEVTYFQLNRWFLLLTLICGLVIPMIDPFPEVQAEGSALVSYYLDPIVVGTNPINIIGEKSPLAETWSWQEIAFRVYIAGLALALLHFLYGLGQLFRLYQSATISRRSGYILAYTEQEHLPFSFFNILFWSRHHQVSPDDEAQIIQHELAHIKGWHSVDVLFLELVSTLMWCSPLVYFYRRSLRNIHEYLADAAVLQTIRPKKYGHLLIRQSQSGPQIALANHFIHSQLKKRFIMMKKRKSKRQVLSRYLLLVPMMFLMTYLFSKNYHTYDSNSMVELETVSNATGEVDEMPRFPGCEDFSDKNSRDLCATKKLFSFIQQNLKYPEAAEKSGTEGKVLIGFVVEADGKLSNIKVLQDIGSGCGNAALAVMKAMPNWIPAKKSGKAVAVDMKLPFSFKLKSDQAGRAGVESNPEQFPVFPSCVENGTSYEEQATCSKKALFQHLFDHLKYPKDAKEQGIEGKVVASFVVGKAGKVRDIKIEKSLSPSCDKAVIEIIHSINDLEQSWLPGKKDGQSVATILTIPVSFKLPKDETKKQLPITQLKVSAFKASPNPTDGRLDVRFQAEARATQIQVLDINGRAVFSQEITDFDGTYTQQINLEKAPKGALILQISQGEQIFTHQIILQ